MTKQTENEMRKAERSLDKILENVDPYIRRPVVKEYSTRGRWTLTDSHSVEDKKQPRGKVTLNNLFA